METAYIPHNHTLTVYCNDVLEWDVVYTFNTNDVTRFMLELIDLEHLVEQSAEYGLRFIA